MNKKLKKSDNTKRILDVVNFDYNWIFSNGIELDKGGENFKAHLKEVYFNHLATSRLVLKTNNKVY